MNLGGGGVPGGYNDDVLNAEVTFIGLDLLSDRPTNQRMLISNIMYFNKS